MHAGVTGHQHRDGIDWKGVSRLIRSELSKLTNIEGAWSCLASGSDQVFTEVALELKIPCMAVIPIANYEDFFEESDLLKYRRLMSQSTVIHFPWKGESNRAFYEAGKFIVDRSDLIFAIWDGEKSEGLGGTADIVTYANSKYKRMIFINPFSLQILRR